MKRYRASIYVDIYAENDVEAEKIGREISNFLSCPADYPAPEGYCNPYFGAAGEIVKGNLIQTSKNLKDL